MVFHTESIKTAIVSLSDILAVLFQVVFEVLPSTFPSLTDIQLQQRTAEETYFGCQTSSQRLLKLLFLLLSVSSTFFLCKSTYSVRTLEFRPLCVHLISVFGSDYYLWKEYKEL